MSEAFVLSHATVFEYLYRASGIQTHGALLLAGRVPDAEDTLRQCLITGSQFVAEQAGIPSLCTQHWASNGTGPSSLDHAYHEFTGLRDATPNDIDLPRGGSVPVLLLLMRSAAGRWDVRLSPNYGL